MSNYPDLSKVAKADHLLFDLGYSYALLHRLQAFLRRLEPTIHSPTLRMEIDELMVAMQGLQEGRLQLRHEIYDNAEPAVAINEQLAALDRIIEAADNWTGVICEELSNAITAAKKVTGKGLPELRTIPKNEQT